MSFIQPPSPGVAAYERTAAETDEPPDPYAHVNLKGCRILLVEDERAIRELTVRCLRAAGMTDVTDVSSAGAAWTSLVGENARGFDVMITDLSLPGVSGQTLIKKLRELPVKRAKTLPIIVLSGDSSIESYQQLRRYRISSYLIKPVSPRLLRSTIARAITTPLPPVTPISPKE